MRAAPASLRFPEPADAAALCEAVRESIDSLQRWMAWCWSDYSRADSERWIAAQPEARAAGQAFEFLIVAADGRILGSCGVNQIHLQTLQGNLGYWVRSSAAGKGVATAAAASVAAWVFDRLGLQRLEVVVAIGNHASLRVAERLGARREAVAPGRLVIHGSVHDAIIHVLDGSNRHRLPRRQDNLRVLPGGGGPFEGRR